MAILTHPLISVGHKRVGWPVDAIPKDLRPPPMTHSCEIAEAIPRSTPTGEFARGQRRVGGHDGHPVVAVLLQSCSAGPGGRADDDLHAKCVDSLCDATLGVLCSALRGPHDRPGAGRRTWPEPKACHEQVDRLLSNPMMTSTISSFAGCRMSSAHATPSWWHWTGPTLTPTSKPPSCCP